MAYIRKGTIIISLGASAPTVIKEPFTWVLKPRNCRFCISIYNFIRNLHPRQWIVIAPGAPDTYEGSSLRLTSTFLTTILSCFRHYLYWNTTAPPINTENKNVLITDGTHHIPHLFQLSPPSNKTRPLIEPASVWSKIPINPAAKCLQSWIKPACLNGINTVISNWG